MAEHDIAEWFRRPSRFEVWMRAWESTARDERMRAVDRAVRAGIISERDRPMYEPPPIPYAHMNWGARSGRLPPPIYRHG